MKNRGSFFRYWVRLVLVLIIGGFFSAPSYAALTTSFTVQQLTDFLNGYRNSNDPRKQLLWTDFQNKLADKNVSLTPAGFVKSSSIPSKTRPVLTCDQIMTLTVGSALLNAGGAIGQLVLGIPPTPVMPIIPPIGPVSASYGVDWTATLNGANSALGFSYENSYLNLNAAFDVTVLANLQGSFDWKYAWEKPVTKWETFPEVCVWTPWGKECATPPSRPYPGFELHCDNAGKELWSVDAGGTIKGDMNARLDVTLATYGPNDSAQYPGQSGYRILIGSGVQEMSVNMATVDDTTKLSIHSDWLRSMTPLWGTAESEIQQEVNENIVDQYLKRTAVPEALRQLQGQLPYISDLPPSIDPILLRLLSEVINLPFLQDYIEQHAQEIIFYLLIGDRQALVDMFASDAACAAVGSLRASSGMLPLPVYTNTGGICVAADPEGANVGPYFADSGCTAGIDFQPTPLRAWCTEGLGSNSTSLLGNAAVWTANATPEPIPGVRSQKWSIAQGTQLPLASEPTAGKAPPFMKRVDYRDIAWKSPAVNCQLEMRIYKKDVNATNLIPLLAVHGGSWTYRGAGFIGMEAQISHYTEQGFVVFAPFYRLAGNSDANPECQGAAWSDLTFDAEQALTWVQAHGATFGAKPGKISLMGQSAGAHLAGWLVTHRPNDVERALLLYPPADVRDLLSNINGAYAAYQPNLGILGTYYGVSVTDLLNVNVNNPPPYVTENSFRDLVANANAQVPPVQMPPVFLMHGNSDTLIPSNQSVILCNAYGGTAIDNGGGAALRATYNCGPNGHLHLFQEANHALDACLTTRVNGACMAGSESSRVLVADSLRQARGWLQGTVTPAALMSILSIILY